MFVCVKKIGPYEYLYLVENVREGGRHVQRVKACSSVRLSAPGICSLCCHVLA